MTRIQRLMKLHRLHNAVGAEGSDLPGGTSTGGEGGSAGGDAGGSGDSGNDGGSDDSGDGKGGESQGEGKGGEGDAGAKKGLSDADAKLLQDLMKHKTRARELEASLAQVNEQLKAFEGIDPAKMRELLKQQEEAERKAAESRGEYDRIVKQMGDRHREETAALTAKLEAAIANSSTLQAQIADLTVGNSFASSRFVAEDMTLTPTKARIVYGSHFEFKDGKVVGYDKPAGASDRTVLVDATGEPLSFDEALRKLVEADPDKEQLIRAKSRPGSASSTTAKGAQKAVEKVAQATNAKLSGADKIAAGLKALANSRS